MQSASVPQEFAHAVITASLCCRRCGYDLQGLRAEGKCPECGLHCWESVLHTVDPDASRLPRLSDHKAVGNGLFWVTLCMTLATLGVVLLPAALQVQALDPRVSGVVAPVVVRNAALYGAVVALLGLYSSVALAPPRGERAGAAEWRDIYLLSAGLLAWSVLSTVRWWLDLSAGGLTTPLPERVGSMLRSVTHLGMGLAAITALVSFRSVLVIVGQRSREFRTARGGRQRIFDMIIAVAGIGIAEVLRLADEILDLPTLRVIGTIVIWISTFMLIVGLVYLMVNTWWIRSALRRPAPGFDEILLPPLPDDTTIGGIDEEDEPFHVLAKGETLPEAEE